ncbi:MAG: HIT domain-containing protein [Thermofilaceae archaeon]|nr:HIT domain-containing protein [Thermofilaceae archaeon]
MEQLWAPWRMKYIEYTTIKKENGCFICKAIESKNPDECYVVHRTSHTIVLLNAFPYNTGHLLIAPVKHVADLSQLLQDDLCDLAITLTKSIELLKSAFNPDGFNIGMNIGKVAGAGLDTHVHVHLVPRWLGDTNFMPIISNTKVIPEALSDTLTRLKKHLEKLS